MSTSTQTLNSVALNVVDQYGNAGKHLAQAWHGGLARMIGGASERYSNFVQTRSIPFVSEQVKADLVAAQERISGIVLNGVHAAAGRSVQAVDSMTSRTSGAISALGNTAGRVEMAFNVSPTAVATMRQVNLPAAHLALQVAEKVAQGAKAIEARVVSTEIEVVVTPKRATKPARRAARK